MKIIHLLPTFNINKKYQEFYLAKYQAKLGHEVYIITSKDNEHKEELTNIDGFKIIRLPKIFGYSDFVLCKSLKKVIKEIKPDIVHAHDLVQGFQVQGSFYKKYLNYKYIVDQHKYSKTVSKSLLLIIEYYLLRKWVSDIAYGKADLITYIVPLAKDFVTKNHSLYKGKFIQIPLGYDPEIYYPSTELRKKYRKNYKIEDETYTIITSGVLQPFKKTELLIEAFKRLNFRKKLFIVGSGDRSYEKKLQNLASDDENIVFLPYQKEDMLNSLYNMADLAIWPIQPTVSIISAMASGVQVIIPDSEITNFYLENGGGNVYKKGDLDDLVFNIEEIKNKKNILNTNIFESIHNYKKISEKYLQVYNDLLTK